MKKVLLLAIACVFSITCFAKKDDAIKISIDQLPEKASLFIKDYFKGFKVKKVYKEFDEDGIVEYKVVFKSKSSIEFDMVGAWSEISINPKKDKMPRFIYPKAICETVDEMFYDQTIVNVENDGIRYEFKFQSKDECVVRSNGDLVVFRKND